MGRKRYKVVTSAFLCAFTALLSMSADLSANERPRLVVGVMIDGLDRQYIDLLRSQFGKGGFNRLLTDGIVIDAVDYGTNTDATASVAMVMTGTPPATNSISGSSVFNRETLREETALTDPDVMGNFTNQTFSPRTLSVSTLADEVRISGGGVNHVFGIAADPSQAVVLAGHSGTAALWLNDKTGNWASSTYYKDLPTGITYRNRLKPLSSRLDTISWVPSRPKEAYIGLPEHLTHYPFRYTFPYGADTRYSSFIASPMINREITDLAIEIIDELGLGKNDGTDMVNIVYNLKPYDFTKNNDNRYELIDSYFRLDNDLERLFNEADKKAGDANTLFFVAATPPAGLSRRDDERWMIPYGEFSTKKAKSLLNMYLMAKFGNGDWVTAYFKDQFYLNHKLVNELHLDIKEVRTEAAAFLERMSGVNRVITVDEILGGRGDARLEALQRNTVVSDAGDLFVEIAPGWETVDDINKPADEKRVRYVHRYAAPTAPVYILSKNLKPRQIENPVDASVLAPTVARLLRIRSPNGASLPPLVL